MTNCEWQCPVKDCVYAKNLKQVLDDLKKGQYQNANWFNSVRDQIDLAKQYSCNHPILTILIAQGETALRETLFLNMLDNL